MTAETSTNVVRQLRDFGVCAVLAIVVATCAFVAVRNHELIDSQLALASRAADDVAAERSPIPDVYVAIIGPAQASERHPYLRHRAIYERGAWRPLVASGALEATGPTSIYDKLVYDAAARFDRTGKFEAILRDGTARAIAARKAPNGIAVAIAPPARPASYPFLVMIGVLGLGALIAGAGALVGGRAARVATFAGIATLAIPPALWRSPVAATAIVLLGAALALAQRVHLTDRIARGMRRNRTALAFLAPTAIAMLVLVIGPFVIGLTLGFYDHKQGEWSFVGVDNFTEILSGNGHELDDPLNFWFILGVTVLWTIANVALHVTLGVGLALILSRTWLRGRGVFRMLFILPWAVPNYITALIWKGMFTGEYGAMNSILHTFGLDGVSWFSSWSTAFTANVMTNTWLGFPFMMVVALGALESIPRELYEAASVDGASAWQRFRHITLPHLRPALGPAVALGSIWTFNMFNVIYLVSGGKPGDSTNILVTDAYRWAFERGERYGMAAAYATIIFLILLLWTVFGARIARSKEAEA